MGVNEQTGNNPALSGFEELTAQEEQTVTEIAGLSYSQGDILYHDGSQFQNLGIGSSGDVLQVGGSSIPEWGSTPAAGSDTQVQFNDGGSFGAEVGFTYDKSTNTLSVPLLDIDGNWVFDTETEASVERLRLQATGANDPAELFLQAKGTANSARITVTPHSSTSNFTSLTLESDGTNNIVNSKSDGTESTLPLELQIDGTAGITLDTSRNTTLAGNLDIGGTVTMDGGTTTIDSSELNLLDGRSALIDTAGTALSKSTNTLNYSGGLSDQSDANVSTPAAGEVLIYHATNSQFENSTLTAGSNTTITEGDASITIASSDTTYSAGSGLALSSTTFSVDITNETSVTAASSDEVLIADASDASNIKKVTAQSIADLSSGGSAITLDLGDDGANESSDLTEIATSGDTNSVFTEPTADKLLIDVSKNWPTADSVASLSGNNVESTDNVAVSTPAAGHVLIYHGTNSQFENATLSSSEHITITNADGSVTIGSSFTASSTDTLTNKTFGNTATFNEDAAFDAEVDDSGYSSGTVTIDWSTGNKHTVTLTDDATISFTDPAGPCNVILRLVQDSTGSRNPSWPANVKWSGGSEPTWSTGASAEDIVSFYYNGTDYYGQAGIGFA